jgi:hypothetical protein
MFKWLIIIVALALTLGLKLLVRPDKNLPTEADIRQKVADFLARQRFTVAFLSESGEGRPMIRAGSGACRILVANSNPIAWDRDVFRSNVTAADQVFVVFRGRTYEDQPTWLTAAGFLWSRLQRELGLRAEAASVLTIIATRGCDAERLPWSELG